MSAISEFILHLNIEAFAALGNLFKPAISHQTKRLIAKNGED